MVNSDPNHVHTFDQYGNITCCSLEEKIENKTPALTAIFDHEEDHDHDHDHDHQHDYRYLPAIFSLILLLSGLALDHWLNAQFFTQNVKLIWYLVAYLPVGLPVMKEAFQALRKGEFFTEFFLMSIATIGAFVIGEYPEGVAVMLFYAIGELFQTAAVKKAKNNIKALMDVRPDIAHVLRNNSYVSVDPEEVSIGEKIMVKAGEMIPLDGELVSATASLNTAALTGESKPRSITKGNVVLAGAINLGAVIEILVDKIYEDSSVSRILHLVQDATSRKAKTELLIRRLAKIYTPIVTYLAIGICLIPYFFVENYDFEQWLYRGLIFLVISCPCALVISIPLGYFGGLGAASRNGILFKGATYMDMITKVRTLVMDKTGTLTKGVFKVKNVVTQDGITKEEMLAVAASIESHSTHPIAKAIKEFQHNVELPKSYEIKEIAGKGMTGVIDGKKVLIGNVKLLMDDGVKVPDVIDQLEATFVLVSIDGQFSGYIAIDDELKDDAILAVEKIRNEGIQKIVMLSGDKDSITKRIAKTLKIDKAVGGLLPERKLKELEVLKCESEGLVAFVGDGINDAPVLAASDVGIAMGALGSDVAIETADIIIQTDHPSKIATGIKIGKVTQMIIWQNISMAMGVKILVLILGAMGIATMWAAVFADVGVALLAILNAVRIQRMNFE